MCTSHASLTAQEKMVLMWIHRHLHCRIHHRRGPVNCVRNIIGWHNSEDMHCCNGKYTQIGRYKRDDPMVANSRNPYLLLLPRTLPIYTRYTSSSCCA